MSDFDANYMRLSIPPLSTAHPDYLCSCGPSCSPFLLIESIQLSLLVFLPSTRFHMQSDTFTHIRQARIFKQLHQRHPLPTHQITLHCRMKLYD